MEDNAADVNKVVGFRLWQEGVEQLFRLTAQLFFLEQDIDGEDEPKAEGHDAVKDLRRQIHRGVDDAARPKLHIGEELFTDGVPVQIGKLFRGREHTGEPAGKVGVVAFQIGEEADDVFFQQEEAVVNLWHDKEEYHQDQSNQKQKSESQTDHPLIPVLLGGGPWEEQGFQ